MQLNWNAESGIYSALHSTSREIPHAIGIVDPLSAKHLKNKTRTDRIQRKESFGKSYSTLCPPALRVDLFGYT